MAADARPDRKTILIIENEDNLLVALRYNLEREEFHVLTATDGRSWAISPPIGGWG